MLSIVSVAVATPDHTYFPNNTRTREVTTSIPGLENEPSIRNRSAWAAPRPITRILVPRIVDGIDADAATFVMRHAQTRSHRRYASWHGMEIVIQELVKC
jgi:hypothetical protein